MLENAISMVVSGTDPDGHKTTPLLPELDLDIKGFDVVEVGVRELVKVLWGLGYRTVCSCAGHTKGLEPYPWVVIPVGSANISNPLDKLAMAVARFNVSLGKNGRLPEALKTWVLAPHCHVQGLLIYLQPLDTNIGRLPERISELRQSSAKLALFVKNECADIFI